MKTTTPLGRTPAIPRALPAKAVLTASRTPPPPRAPRAPYPICALCAHSWQGVYAAMGIEASSAAALLLSFPLTLYHVLRHARAVAEFSACSHGTEATDDTTRTAAAADGEARGAEVRVYILGPSGTCEGALLESYAVLARCGNDTRVKGHTRQMAHVWKGVHA